MPKVHTPGESAGLRSRSRRVSTSLAEINVVPLVDVMLVLLIIFMVTAPMIQRGIDVKLPVSRRASAVEGERLFVTVPATFKTDGMVFLGDEKLRATLSRTRLSQTKSTAVTAFPGRPRISSGTNEAVAAELFDDSGPATPAIAPCPNFSGVFDIFFSSV